MKALPLFPYFLDKCLTIPTSPFFRLLINGFSLIREYGSTLYVGLAHAVPPTNTNFQPLLLLTQVGMPCTNTHKYRMSYFKSTPTFMGPAKRWKSLSAARQKWEILAILHHHNNNFKIFSSISSDEIPPRSTCKCLQNLYQSVAIYLKYVLLVLLLHLLMYLGL